MLNDKVSILYKNINILEDPHKSRRINKLYSEIKNKYEWIINVDIDEYITTKILIKQ